MVNSFSTLRDSLKLVLKYLKHGTSRACNVSFFSPSPEVFGFIFFKKKEEEEEEIVLN